MLLASLLFFSVALKNALARAFKIFWPVNLVTFVDLESEKKWHQVLHLMSLHFKGDIG